MKDYKYLNKINSPADLKVLQEDEIIVLADEIRDCLVETVTKNGGHLASNLGVVELTLAIHRVFDIPKDHLIFDVGHQSYVHKIITGRRERFDTIRTGGGISGFSKRSESESDCFGTGHSSTSVSAGLGFAIADRLQGNDATTVVVLGDGAFTGGMVHEALNNIERNLRLVIVLNENEMSISKNIGSFAKMLTKLRLHPTYVSTKGFFRNIISHIPLIGKPLFRFLRNLKKRIKDFFYGSNYFEDLGLFYVGPVDGNDEKQLEDALRIAKSCHESAIVHIKTKKGKGFAPAEENPSQYHGISPAKSKPQITNFSNEFGKYMIELARDDDKVVAITAAMLDGTGLVDFAKEYPQRIFDVGIAEEHALTFACGLAAEGIKPYFAVYSTFLQRSYDNIIHDMALQGLPVKLCIDRAGLNASDGPTHHGIYDVAMLSHIPNMTLYTPISYASLKKSLLHMNECDSPCAVRYSKGEENCEIINHFGIKEETNALIHKDFEDADKLDAVIVTHGSIAIEAIKAQKILQEEGISVGIILVERIMPYSALANEISLILPKNSIKIVTLEEEIKSGGFGMMLLDNLSSKEIMKNKTCSIVAIENSFADKYGEDIRASVHIDSQTLIYTIKEM